MNACTTSTLLMIRPYSFGYNKEISFSNTFLSDFLQTRVNLSSVLRVNVSYFVPASNKDIKGIFV